MALAVFSGLLFCFAAPISKRLGQSGMGVVTRVMGLILAAIAMGMLAEGLRGIPGESGPTKVTGKYIVIWKRSGQTWQLHRDIWNTN